MMGLEGLFDVIPSPLDETASQSAILGLSPPEYTKHLAEQKALALAKQLRASSPDSSIPTIVLGSDTIVEQQGRILEKPRDIPQARDMLFHLAGRDHAVHTGVALYLVESAKVRLLDSWTETTTVWFAALSLEDIEAYISTGEPMDKAGAYGIQGIGGQFVERIDGDFFTVMGLPMHSLSRELARIISLILNRMVR
jgi:septum formation protein